MLAQLLEDITNGLPETVVVVKCRFCRRKSAVTGPDCWYHTIINEGVGVGPSFDALGNPIGRGLFAYRTFNEGDFISKYDGIYFPANIASLIYTGADKSVYLFNVGDGIVDGRISTCGNARYIQDYRGKGFPNCALVCDPDPFRRCKALRKINRGEEFLTDYGIQYWLNKKK